MIKLKIRYYNAQADIRFPCTEKVLKEALAEIGAEQVLDVALVTGDRTLATTADDRWNCM